MLRINIINMIIKIYNGYWTPKTLVENPNYLFIFGDNDLGYGKKGQAIIRDEINSIGIPTKKEPNYKKTSYYTDEELEENKNKIDNAIENIIKKINNDKIYDTVVFPNDGLGTGLADLPKLSPLTFEYLTNKIEELKVLLSNL